ncbi:MAG: arylesterase [Acidobacteriaceae bacterium]|nr:arylesterase [Acidobacteriaceae bacterium]
MKRALPVILSALVLLVGCKTDNDKADSGVGASATSVAHDTAHSAAADTRPLLICFGDSITAGYGIESGLTYPQQLQQKLDHDGFSYRVANAGVSGNTTKDGVDRVARIIARHPQVVVVEFGGNDALRGLPLEQTQTNLASIVGQLQAAHIDVAIAGITIPPDYGKQYVSRFDAIFPAVAKRYNVPLLPFVLQGVYGVPGSIQQDGIHPTAQGAVQVAANVEALIKPLLKR